uniref:Putative methyltransferase n=1 Tax=Aplysina aerophoba bacterial symbiont clone AANRPS TaxID=1042317 RepID=F8S305_9BACT|nr:putative methyltransferase [Aplysina aerophoba bacterial symbiont clone AANRPS]
MSRRRSRIDHRAQHPIASRVGCASTCRVVSRCSGPSLIHRLRVPSGVRAGQDRLPTRRTTILFCEVREAIRRMVVPIVRRRNREERSAPGPSPPPRASMRPIIAWIVSATGSLNMIPAPVAISSGSRENGPGGGRRAAEHDAFRQPFAHDPHGPVLHVLFAQVAGREDQNCLPGREGERSALVAVAGGRGYFGPDIDGAIQGARQLVGVRDDLAHARRRGFEDDGYPGRGRRRDDWRRGRGGRSATFARHKERHGRERPDGSQDARWTVCSGGRQLRTEAVVRSVSISIHSSSTPSAPRQTR